ncbi:AI-2E family transporter [Parvularcula sp. IMCC14364]|uniref:AI-2E family transporter n=1 Tax=Parvularcula sp. IMCC14364 TaxID=3067902 RepID=UPI0027418A1D|nr:AI-2E family transporter [Parvularcula sp. IMCC14364]
MPDQKSEKVSLYGQGLPRLFYASALAILIGYVLYIGQSIIIPLVFALFLTFIIVTVKNSIERLPGLGKILPEWLSFVLAFGLITLVMIVLGQIVIANGEAMLAEFPEYRQKFLEIAANLINYLSQFSFLQEYFPAQEINASDEVTAQLPPADMELFAQWQDQLINIATSFVNDVRSAIATIGANLVTILLYTGFMLIERGKFLVKLHALAGADDDRLDVDQIVQDIGTLVRQYISIKTTTSFIVAVLSWIIMLILGIDFAGFWALLIFSLNFIPIIGSIIAVILPSALALVQPDGGGITLFILTILLLTTAEQVVGSVIEPRLLGKSLNLSPLVILLSLTFWGTLWGFGGMLLCIPITVGIMIVLSQFEASRGVAIMLSENGKIKPIQRKMSPPTATEAN